MNIKEIICKKFELCGSLVTIRGYKGNSYNIWLTSNNDGVGCSATKQVVFTMNMFEAVVDYMEKHGGKIRKGKGRNHKFGDYECDENTVVGIIAILNENPKIGDSVLDPVHGFSAILDWADIAYNKLGYLELKNKTGGDF